MSEKHPLLLPIATPIVPSHASTSTLASSLSSSTNSNPSPPHTTASLFVASLHAFQTDKEFREKTAAGETSAAQSSASSSYHTSSSSSHTHFLLSSSRWSTLLLFSFLTLTNSLSFLLYSPLALTFARDIWNVSTIRVYMLSIGWMMVYVVGSVVFATTSGGGRRNKRNSNTTTTIISKNYDLRHLVVTAAILNLLGGFLRVLPYPFVSYTSAPLASYRFACAGTLLCAAAQIFLLSTPALLAQNWFAAHERLTATAIGTAANTLGGALAYLLPVIVLPAVIMPEEMTEEDGRVDEGTRVAVPPVERLLITQFLLVTFAFWLILNYFEARPQTPPNWAAQKELEREREERRMVREQMKKKRAIVPPQSTVTAAPSDDLLSEYVTVSTTTSPSDPTSSAHTNNEPGSTFTATTPAATFRTVPISPPYVRTDIHHQENDPESHGGNLKFSTSNVINSLSSLLTSLPSLLHSTRTSLLHSFHINIHLFKLTISNTSFFLLTIAFSLCNGINYAFLVTLGTILNVGSEMKNPNDPGIGNDDFTYSSITSTGGFSMIIAGFLSNLIVGVVCDKVFSRPNDGSGNNEGGGIRLRSDIRYIKKQMIFGILLLTTYSTFICLVILPYLSSSSHPYFILINLILMGAGCNAPEALLMDLSIEQTWNDDESEEDEQVNGEEEEKKNGEVTTTSSSSSSSTISPTITSHHTLQYLLLLSNFLGILLILLFTLFSTFIFTLTLYGLLLTTLFAYITRQWKEKYEGVDGRYETELREEQEQEHRRELNQMDLGFTPRGYSSVAGGVIGGGTMGVKRMDYQNVDEDTDLNDQL